MSIPGRLYIPEAISEIERLLEDGAGRNVLYACLEARRALEAIAYNRLAVHLCDTEGELLSGWQPNRILKFLSSEADEHATVGAKMAVADPDFCHGGDAQDIPEDAWIHLGEQKEVNVRALNSLYQALSSFLHVAVPRRKDRVTTSFEAGLARQKVDHALNFLQDFCDETALLPLPFEKFRFPCSCGYINQRSAIWLQEGRVFSCGKSGCNESYEVRVCNDGFCAERRYIRLKCHRCKEEIDMPMAAIPNRIARYQFSCMHCSARHELSWQPAYKLITPD